MEKVKIFASCHNHSTFSDGEHTPERLAEIAKGEGHGGIILTDHDTVKGTYFMNKAARKLGLKSILGCEFSTYHKGVGVHLLGFDFNPDNKKMAELLAFASSIQTDRTELLFKWGLETGAVRGGCTWQDVRDDHPYHDYICNNEVFASLMKRGIYEYSEYEDFFQKSFAYAICVKLGYEAKIAETLGKSYKDISTESVVKIILEAGGVPVVAHPHGLMKYADDFLSMGVMGFETRHPELTDSEMVDFDALCTEKKLYKMGGSDHSGVLGGLLDFGEEYYCPYEKSGVTEENFMTLYERRLG